MFVFIHPSSLMQIVLLIKHILNRTEIVHDVRTRVFNHVVDLLKASRLVYGKDT